MSDHEEDAAYQELQQLIPLLVADETRQEFLNDTKFGILTEEIPDRLPEATEIHDDPLNVVESRDPELTLITGQAPLLPEDDITDVASPSASQEDDVWYDQTPENEIDNREISMDTFNGRETPNTTQREDQHVVSRLSFARDRTLPAHMRRHEVNGEFEYQSRVSTPRLAQEIPAPSMSSTSKGAIFKRLGSVKINLPSNDSSLKKARDRRCAICRSRAHPTVDHGDPEKLREYRKKRRERLRETSFDRYYIPSLSRITDSYTSRSENHCSPPRARHYTAYTGRNEESRFTKKERIQREDYQRHLSTSRYRETPEQSVLSKSRFSSMHRPADIAEVDEMNGESPNDQQETSSGDYPTSDDADDTRTPIAVANTPLTDRLDVTGSSSNPAAYMPAQEMHASMAHPFVMPPTSPTPVATASVQPQIINTNVSIAQLNPLIQAVRIAASLYEQLGGGPVDALTRFVPQLQRPVLSQQQSPQLQPQQPQQIQFPSIQQLQQPLSHVTPLTQEPLPPVQQQIPSYTTMQTGDIPNISQIPREIMLSMMCNDYYCPWKNPKNKEKCRDPKCRLAPRDQW